MVIQRHWCLQGKISQLQHATKHVFWTALVQNVWSCPSFIQRSKKVDWRLSCGHQSSWGLSVCPVQQLLVQALWLKQFWFRHMAGSCIPDFWKFYRIHFAKVYVQCSGLCLNYLQRKRARQNVSKNAELCSMPFGKLFNFPVLGYLCLLSSKTTFGRWWLNTWTLALNCQS